MSATPDRIGTGGVGRTQWTTDDWDRRILSALPDYDTLSAMQRWTAPNAQYPPPKPGEPPLHRAARLGDHEEVRRLAAGGADLNAVFDIGLDPGARDWPATPLMVAAGSGDGATVETVELLLSVGADPSLVVDSNSAATFACEGLGWNYRPGGDASRFEVLLKAGSPLPKNPGRANEVLCRAARAGDVERLKVLLAHGLNARGHWDRDIARRRALAFEQHMHAYRAGKSDLLAQLGEGMPPDMRAEFVASMTKMEEERLEQSCSAPSPFEIPLFCAAESGSAECVATLLAQGADPLARDSSKRTAMYSAGTIGVVRALLAAGVPIEDEDEYGWSPLMDAVGDGESGIARVGALIDARADVNATHDRGYTVFMSAVGSGRHPEILRMLIAAGADPHALSDLGFNAFHAAIDVNGAEANAEESVQSTYAYLKQLGVNIEQRNTSGYTPLGLALQRGNGVAVRVLCELGADPNAACPIMSCGTEGCSRVVAPMIFGLVDGTNIDADAKLGALLQAGASPLAKDAEGQTPLVRAVAGLCQQGDEYEGLFRQFFHDLSKTAGAPTHGMRDRFIAAAIAAIRPVAESLGSAIPIPTTSQYDERWRTQRLACITLLAAYERWHRKGSSSPKATGGPDAGQAPPPMAG